MDEMVEVLGIVGLVVIVFAVLSGVAIKYKWNKMFKIHRFSGYVALALAIGHGILAILS